MLPCYVTKLRFLWKNSSLFLFQTRGVADRKKLPYFPYRDDGGLVWKQVKSFVKDYVRLYVQSRPIEYFVNI